MDFDFNKAKNMLVQRKSVCGIMSIKYIYFCFQCTLYVENPCINSKEFHTEGLHELYKNIDFSSVLALVGHWIARSPIKLPAGTYRVACTQCIHYI